MESYRDAELKRIHNQSFLSTPDGMPMVWLARWNGYSEVERVYGPDLMLEIMKVTAGTRRKHFFWGGNEGVADELREAMESSFPGTEVAGTDCPPFRPLTRRGRGGPRGPAAGVEAALFLGGAEHAEAGALHARHVEPLPGPHEGLGARHDHARGGSRLRLPHRPREPGAGLDSALRTGMVLPGVQGAAASLETIRGQQHGFLRAILPQLMDLRHYPMEK